MKCTQVPKSHMAWKLESWKCSQLSFSRNKVKINSLIEITRILFAITTHDKFTLKKKLKKVMSTIGVHELGWWKGPCPQSRRMELRQSLLFHSFKSNENARRFAFIEVVWSSLRSCEYWGKKGSRVEDKDIKKGKNPI